LVHGFNSLGFSQVYIRKERISKIFLISCSIFFSFKISPQKNTGHDIATEKWGKFFPKLGHCQTNYNKELLNYAIKVFIFFQFSEVAELAIIHKTT